MSSGTPPSVRTTRTGRRVVPTPAAAAAAADKASTSTEKEKEKTTTVTEKSASEKSTPATTTRANTRGSIRPVKEAEQKKETPKPATVVKETAIKAVTPKEKQDKEDDTPKQRRGLRSTARVSSGSNDESAAEVPSAVTPAKRSKLSESETEKLDVVSEAIGKSDIIMKEDDSLVDEETEDSDQEMETQEITDDSQIFEAVAKMNAEAQQHGIIHPNAHVAHVVHTDVQVQQQSAVDSILAETSTVQAVPQTEETEEVEGGELTQFVTEDVQTVELNPPWNEQGCIICNVDISIDDPVNQSPKTEQLKEFFLEFFSVGDQISLEDETAFPFCSKCAEEMEGLLTVSQNIETMHKQFNKVRDSMSKKAIKTFLSRTKPNCLEDDAKSENYGFMDEEQKKSYKDQMFSLWKSRYELVQPGPKTPIMIRSMDSRGRVTVVRLNSHGQAVPDKFGGVRGVVRPEVPLGGMGRLLTNGEDEEESANGMGGSLEIYHCKECPKAFSAKSLLAYHSRVHTGELPYECDQCGKAFSVPHYLMTHMKTHSNDKPYKCLECGKGFAQRGGLVTHSLVHTGAKPFSCQICGKSFRQKYHLTQHNLIHSGVKPFSCELCGKAFNVKMNLREHMRRHTGDRPYKCPYCTTVGFFRKKMLKDHITKAHPQRAMPEELMGPEPSTSYIADSNDSNEMQDDDEEMDHMEDLEETEEMLLENEEGLKEEQAAE